MSKSLTTIAAIVSTIVAAGSLEARAQFAPPVRGQSGGPVVVQRGNTPAADWAKKLFSVDKIDFGVIATGSDSKKFVRVRNVLDKPVNIRSATTTCGCSVATPSKKYLQPGEESIIEITMNTKRFKRRKDSNVIVTLDQPSLAEVRIPITAYIRTDVVFGPGMVQFGNTEVAKGGKFQVKISYAGRPNWMIKELQVGNQHLAAMFNETRRAGGRVDYTLEVTLKPTAPVGRLRDLIILVTDDEANPFVPLLVEANVEPDIVVTPGIVSLRSLAPGQQVRAQVVIRGKAPFEVEKIESVNGVPGFQARRPQLSKPVHVVPFSLTAQSTAGRFEEEFKVWIVGRPEPVTFKATGEVVGANPRLGSNR